MGFKTKRDENNGMETDEQNQFYQERDRILTVRIHSPVFIFQTLIVVSMEPEMIFV
jgi:hypothetical protein